MSCTATHFTLRRAAALVVLLLASGCATGKPKQDLFFPPPPDKPRIKWVRSMLSEEDLRQSVWRKMWNALVPHDSTNALNAPSGLALSPDENILYVAVPHRSRVVAVNRTTGAFSAIGTGGRTPLGRPIGVAVDATGRIYVSDKTANVVMVYGADGQLVDVIGRQVLADPTGIAVDRRNQLLYVVNDASKQEGKHTVEAFSLAGKHLRTIGGRSSEPGYFNFPRSVAVSRTGELHVVDMLNFRVQVFDTQGRLMRFYGNAGNGYPGQFDKIHSVAFDTFDNAYVADAVQGVHILNTDGQPLLAFGPPVMQAPTAVVIDSKNTIFVADLLHKVHEFQLVNTRAEDSFKKSTPAAKTPATKAPAATPAAPKPAASGTR